MFISVSIVFKVMFPRKKNVVRKRLHVKTCKTQYEPNQRKHKLYIEWLVTGLTVVPLILKCSMYCVNLN